MGGKELCVHPNVIEIFKTGFKHFPELTLEQLFQCSNNNLNSTSVKLCRDLYPCIFNILNDINVKPHIFKKCAQLITIWVRLFRLCSKLKIVQYEPLVQLVEIVNLHRNNLEYERCFEVLLQLIETRTKRLHKILEKYDNKENQLMYICKKCKPELKNFGFREYRKRCIGCNNLLHEHDVSVILSEKHNFENLKVYYDDEIRKSSYKCFRSSDVRKIICNFLDYKVNIGEEVFYATPVYGAYKEARVHQIDPETSRVKLVTRDGSKSYGWKNAEYDVRKILLQKKTETSI